MLPDFPHLKKEIHRLLVLGARIERPRAALLQSVPERAMREGDRIVLMDETGEEEEISLNAYTAEDAVHLTDVQRLTLSETYDRYRDLISQMDQEVATDLGDLQDSKAESVGNVIDFRGRSMPEGILEGVEKMLLLDDPQTVDQLFDLYQVRSMLRNAPADAVEEAREQMKTGAYKEQTERLLARKHEEYRVRENSRQLVG